MQRDRRIVDERELSDSEDEDGDKRRDHSEAKPITKKRKTSSEAVNGIAEVVSASSTELTETIVKIPSTTDEASTIAIENNEMEETK